MKPGRAAAVIGTRFGMLSLLAGLVLVLGGCAAETNPALRNARTTYEIAAANPQVRERAPVALHEAHQELVKAENKWDDDHDEDEAQHDAYLVDKRVEIARVRSEGAAAEATGQQLAEELQDLAKTRQTDRGTVITFDSDVLFAVDQANLKPGAMQDINRLASILQEHPDRTVLVEGHTDSTGSAAYNQDLSERRAESVASQLIRAGVDPVRIQVRGYGESQPVAPNSNAAGRQENRRVDVVVQPQATARAR